MSGSSIESDSRRAYGIDTVYKDGDSEDAFIKRNAFSGQTGYGITNFANPALGLISALRGRAAFNRQRKLYEAKVDANDAHKRGLQQDFRSQQLGAMQAHDDENRTGAMGRLDRAFNDGTRQQGREDQYGAELGNALSGLAEENRAGSRANAIAQAKRGRLGGSRDIEQQSRLGASLQSGVMDASATAQRRLDALNTGDLNQYYSLRRGVLSGDPQREAQYTAMSQNIGNEAVRQGRLDDYLQTRAQLRREGADNTSYAIGGIGRAGASYIDQTYGGR